MKELSVVIVNYNTGELLGKCVDSVKKTAGFAEIIVVDNASTDGSGRALRNFQFSIFNFQFIENKKNLGFARAVNQGIKKAKGEYILLLNPDTVVEPKAIDNMLQFAKLEPSVGAIGARLLNPDGSVQGSVMHFPTLLRAIREFWLGENRAYSKYVPKGNMPAQVETVVMAAFLITPECRKRVGYLDERYFMYFEDLDYCKRIEQAGLKVFYLPSSQVVHYHGVSGRSLAGSVDQWRRLIPSSKIYHGVLKHYIINFVLWSGQKLQNYIGR
ncbi:MAG: glycosyltransferase family 2 protein [Candidatus Blackburnbacteria bacterium]|nr:glycosyltransferase family 2 protein [Candidatus Blackburnbacteria bacterium]